MTSVTMPPVVRTKHVSGVAGAVSWGPCAVITLDWFERHPFLRFTHSNELVLLDASWSLRLRSALQAFVTTAAKKKWGFGITLVKMERSFKNFTHWQARYSKTFVDLRMALLPKPMGRNYFIHYLKPDCDSKLPRPPIPLQTENPSVKKNKKNKTNLTCKVFTSQRNTNSRGSSLTLRSVLFYLARPSTRGAKTYSIMSWKRAAGEIRSRNKK